MEPAAALVQTLSVLFDENELRTLFSTDLYLGDLSHRMPPRGAAGLVPELVAGLLEEKRAKKIFFRTLASLRPEDHAAIHRLMATWFGRRVLVLHGGDAAPEYAAQARHDARQADALAEALMIAGHRPLVCSPTAPGLPPSLTLEASLKDCDALCLVLSAASAGSARTEVALAALATRRGEGSWPIALAVATDASDPPQGLAALLGEPPLPCRDPGATQEATRAILAQLEALATEAVARGSRGGGGADPWPPPRTVRPAPSQRPGPTALADAPRKVLAGEGLEIHQELLAHPVGVSRAGERLEATIDREGVQSMVLGAEARKAVWLSELGSRRRQARAQAWDAWYRDALTGRSLPPPPTDPSPPLRWGGAGVVLEVDWCGERWVPLFFRDILPYGWNLPLGASGPTDRLDDPAAWGTRELLEELIVLRGEPAWGQAIAFQPLLVDAAPDPAPAQTRAIGHARLPLSLRERADRLIAFLGEGLPSMPQPTGADLRIRDGDGERLHRDLLVAASPMELGLDVARVLRVRLEDDASLLDGEVLERPDGRQELVRMPVALLRAARLRELFGPDAPPTREEGSPPSTMVEGLSPEDIHIFPWDVRRRREIALGTRMAEGPADPQEQARHRAWLDRFGEHFLDARGEPSGANPSPLFVGSTARLLAAWAFLTKGCSG